MEKLKWQIHAETSVTNAFLWVIAAKLFGGFIAWLAVVMIAGNLYTYLKSTRRLYSLDEDYFK